MAGAIAASSVLFERGLGSGGRNGMLDFRDAVIPANLFFLLATPLEGRMRPMALSRSFAQAHSESAIGGIRTMPGPISLPVGGQNDRRCRARFGGDSLRAQEQPIHVGN